MDETREEPPLALTEKASKKGLTNEQIERDDRVCVGGVRFGSLIEIRGEARVVELWRLKMRSFFPAISMVLVLVGVVAVSGGGPAEVQPPKVLDVPWSSVGTTVRLIGKAGKPIGTVCVLTGVVVEGPYKGYEGGPNLVIDSVDGINVQDKIQIRIVPLQSSWNETGRIKERVTPEVGKKYRVMGYETACYAGVPNEALQKMVLIPQTSDHYLRTDFVVIELEPLNAPDLPAQKK